MIRTRLSTAALAVVAMASAAPSTAQAQGLLDIGRVLLGLPTEEKPPIDYRERAPLVVPPGQNLRPPVNATPTDQRRANWPQDPDVAARRQAAENARRPANFDSLTNRETGSTRRLTLDEIRAGRIAGAEVPRAATNSISPNPLQGIANVHGGVTVLREYDRQTAANARPNGEIAREEPKREFLTDPPGGLRRPADNAAFRATREGQLGVREEPKPYDIFREGPNTR